MCRSNPGAVDTGKRLPLLTAASSQSSTTVSLAYTRRSRHSPPEPAPWESGQLPPSRTAVRHQRPREACIGRLENNWRNHLPPEDPHAEANGAPPVIAKATGGCVRPNHTGRPRMEVRDGRAAGVGLVAGLRRPDPESDDGQLSTDGRVSPTHPSRTGPVSAPTRGRPDP
jgi:hypothetical protein